MMELTMAHNSTEFLEDKFEFLTYNGPSRDLNNECDFSKIKSITKLTREVRVSKI